MTLTTTADWRRRAARAAALVLAAAMLTAGLAKPAAATAVRQPLVGLEQVSHTTVSNSDPWVKLASVTCPDNKTRCRNRMVDQPGDSPTAATVPHPVRAQRGGSRSTRPTAATIRRGASPCMRCARNARRDGRFSRVTSESTFVDPYHTARVNCSNGRVPLGMGVEHMVPHGPGCYSPTSTRTSPAFTCRPTPHEDGYDDEWWIRAYAICADPPIGWELISSSNQTSYPTTTEASPCSAGRTAISAGADLNGAYGEVVLKSSHHHVPGEYGSATASEDETGAPDSWELTTDVICVQE